MDSWGYFGVPGRSIEHVTRDEAQIPGILYYLLAYPLSHIGVPRGARNHGLIHDKVITIRLRYRPNESCLTAANNYMTATVLPRLPVL